MDEVDQFNLDSEFRRYLQILRPYLAQLTSKTIIAMCNTWIQRLSNCEDNEKILRNKYVFTMCYQVANGKLEEPFINPPPCGELTTINDSLSSSEEDISSEMYVVEPDEHTHDPKSEKPRPCSESDYLSQINENAEDSMKKDRDCQSESKSLPTSKSTKNTIFCYSCPKIIPKYSIFQAKMFENRTNNLICKLREIKNQNLMLRSELYALKQQLNLDCAFYSDNDINKVDHATSTYVFEDECYLEIKSLLFKLNEAEGAKNSLINNISDLYKQIDELHEMKRKEIQDIETKHQFELLDIKNGISEEIKKIYEKSMEDLKHMYERKIQASESQASKDIEDLKQSLVQERKTVTAKNLEIQKLNTELDNLKTQLQYATETMGDTSNVNSVNDNLKIKYQNLEKRLYKMEKHKVRCAKNFEAKLSQLQREKHLAECSLQLQMIRQRAQVINEVAEENQTELVTALDKLEAKYKEIVANVQATAIQRRMQDQLSLEAILQAACGIPKENNSSPGSNQFSKTMRNQNRHYETEESPLLLCNKVGNTVCNKSFGEDSLVAGYCLNSERMAELFERVYIPQRDNPETK